MGTVRSRLNAWPADKVERWPVERLIPYACNARTHSAAQVDQIAASIRQWGWTTPVLVGDDATIIAGHGRVLAARKLRIPEIPVMVANELERGAEARLRDCRQQADPHRRLGRGAARARTW